MSQIEEKPSISGVTKIVGLIADPVAPVQTPQLLNRIFGERNIDAVAIALHVPAGQLDTAWRGLARLQNLAGFVVSIPHKIDAAPLCDDLGPLAGLARSVNAVRREADGRMIGETFDGAGFVAGLRAAGFDPAGRAALLIGAGGAAISIAFALAVAGVRMLGIHNRTETKAHRLAAKLGETFPQIEFSAPAEATGPVDLVVNATPLSAGFEYDAMINSRVLGQGSWAAEAMISPEPTLLARLATQRGAHFVDGRAMLAGQIDLILHHILPDIATQK